MVILVSSSPQAFPNHISPHEDLLCVFPCLPDFHHGASGGPHSAANLCDTVPSLHCYIVYLDRLQDRFLSHSTSFSVTDINSQYSLNGL